MNRRRRSRPPHARETGRWQEDPLAARTRWRLRRGGAPVGRQLQLSEGIARSSYTVAGDGETAREAISSGSFGTAGPDSDLFLLPVAIQGRSCYRVCRGLYTDRASSRELRPRALSAGQARGAPAARAVAVADVCPVDRSEACLAGAGAPARREAACHEGERCSRIRFPSASSRISPALGPSGILTITRGQIKKQACLLRRGCSASPPRT